MNQLPVEEQQTVVDPWARYDERQREELERIKADYRSRSEGMRLEAQKEAERHRERWARYDERKREEAERIGADHLSRLEALRK